MAPVEKDPQKGLNGAVAAVLRGERAALGMKIADLAEAADIPEVSVQRYLAGKRPIDMAILHALSEALGVEPDEVTTSAKGRLTRIDVIWPDQSSNGIAIAATDEGIEPHDDDNPDEPI